MSNLELPYKTLWRESWGMLRYLPRIALIFVVFTGTQLFIIAGVISLVSTHSFFSNIDRYWFLLALAVCVSMVLVYSALQRLQEKLERLAEIGVSVEQFALGKRLATGIVGGVRLDKKLVGQCATTLFENGVLFSNFTQSITAIPWAHIERITILSHGHGGKSAEISLPVGASKRVIKITIRWEERLTERLPSDIRRRQSLQ